MCLFKLSIPSRIILLRPHYHLSSRYPLSIPSRIIDMEGGKRDLMYSIIFQFHQGLSIRHALWSLIPFRDDLSIPSRIIKYFPFTLFFFLTHAFNSIKDYLQFLHLWDNGKIESTLSIPSRIIKYSNYCRSIC